MTLRILYPAILLMLGACQGAAKQPAAQEILSVPDTAAAKLAQTTTTRPNTADIPEPQKRRVVSKRNRKTLRPEIAPPQPDSTIEKSKPSDIPNHQSWDSLLLAFVQADGKVDYAGIKKQRSRLEAYCNYLAEMLPDEGWSREAQMAYWINAYNAFTVKLIVDNYPTESILRFDGGKTWDVKRIRLGNKKYSLNQIENEILRPVFKDPRIHFAINCAAKSCPPLHNRAYTAENLEATLEARTRAFINDGKYNQLSADKAQISKIFEWYAPDFGDIHTFLNRYAESVLRKNAAIRYNDYNWALND